MSYQDMDRVVRKFGLDFLVPEIRASESIGSGQAIYASSSKGECKISLLIQAGTEMLEGLSIITNKQGDTKLRIMSYSTNGKAVLPVEYSSKTGRKAILSVKDPGVREQDAPFLELNGGFMFPDFNQLQEEVDVETAISAIRDTFEVLGTTIDFEPVTALKLLQDAHVIRPA